MKIFTSDAMLSHTNGPGHPECTDRLRAVMDMVQCDFPNIAVEDAYPVDEDLLLLAHPQSYVDFILESTPCDGLTMLDGDTALCPQSYDSALVAVGACVQAVRAVMDGETKVAFAAIRPPGHHAEYATAMGFCIFANAFIAARSSGVRTLIIDFDVHHGNGTEDLVRRRVAGGDIDIAYASTHQGEIFPGTGHDDAQNICNCKLGAGAGTAEFRQAVTDKIIPFARDFAPELIIFSAGFDAHGDDPLGGLNLTNDDFGWIVDAIHPICPKIVSVLEGGYNLEILPYSVKGHLLALKGAGGR